MQDASCVTHGENTGALDGVMDETDAAMTAGSDPGGRPRDPGGAAELADAARSGDRRAFERLVVMYQEGIYRMAYARLQNVSDAQDVVQEVFLNAYRTIGTLRDPALIRAWLYRIALNRVRDVVRRRKVLGFFGLGAQTEPEDHPHPGPDSFDRMASRAFWEHLNAFLETLPAREREVFRLRFVDELSIPEICSVLGKNESTVKTHLYRAVEKFRRTSFASGTGGDPSRGES